MYIILEECGKMGKCSEVHSYIKAREIRSFSNLGKLIFFFKLVFYKKYKKLNSLKYGLKGFIHCVSCCILYFVPMITRDFGAYKALLDKLHGPPGLKSKLIETLKCGATPGGPEATVGD